MSNVPRPPIEEIRERLAAATKAETWESHCYGHLEKDEWKEECFSVHLPSPTYDETVVCPIAGGKDGKLKPDDAEFIAHAGRDIRFLLSEYDRLTARVEHLESQLTTSKASG